jgi:hypothetical protein
LLQKEVIQREDLVEILGPRPWPETSYKDFIHKSEPIEKKDKQQTA